LGPNSPPLVFVKPTRPRSLSRFLPCFFFFFLIFSSCFRRGPQTGFPHSNFRFFQRLPLLSCSFLHGHSCASIFRLASSSGLGWHSQLFVLLHDGIICFWLHPTLEFLAHWFLTPSSRTPNLIFEAKPTPPLEFTSFTLPYFSCDFPTPFHPAFAHLFSKPSILTHSFPVPPAYGPLFSLPTKSFQKLFVGTAHHQSFCPFSYRSGALHHSRLSHFSPPPSFDTSPLLHFF